jgi:hypothetical protein
MTPDHDPLEDALEAFRGILAGAAFGAVLWGTIWLLATIVRACGSL